VDAEARRGKTGGKESGEEKKMNFPPQSLLFSSAKLCVHCGEKMLFRVGSI
jgi:hypothetical protein